MARRKNSIIYEAGKKYNFLTLVAFSHNRNGTNMWICKCDCGAEVIVGVYDVYSGHTQSCGCMKEKLSSSKQKVHGKTETKEYRAWSGMITRCTNKADKKYSYYGGRGIKIHNKWLEKNGKGFLNFLKDMGNAPLNYSLDRIDPDGDYEPSNCRWASAMIQGQNRRSVRMVFLNGEKIPRVEVERRLGLGVGTINRRKNKKNITLQESADYYIKKYQTSKINQPSKEMSFFILGQLGFAA